MVKGPPNLVTTLPDFIDTFDSSSNESKYVPPKLDTLRDLNIRDVSGVWLVLRGKFCWCRNGYYELTREAYLAGEGLTRDSV